MGGKEAKKVILYGIDGTDPVTVKRLVGEGKLPNFKRLMDRGFFTEALPSYSGKTPQNWTTIATGAEPGSHSITDLYVQKVGEPLKVAEKGGTFNGFDSSLSKAEFIWNTAEKAGLSAMAFNYACAAPSTLEKGVWVGGSGEPGPECQDTIAKPQVYALEAGKAGTESLDGVPADIEVLSVWREDLGATAPGTVVFARIKDSQGEAVAILSDTSWSSLQGVLRVDDYSDWMVESFPHPRSGEILKCTWKYKCLSIGDTTEVYRTKIYPAEGLSKPGGIYEELIEKFGPFINEPGHYWSYPIGHDTYDEVNREQLEWLTDSLVYLHQTYQPDLLMMKSHIIDHYAHDFLNKAVKFQEGQTEYEDCYNSLVNSYQIVDDCLGTLLDGVDLDTTHVLLVSDHGCVSNEGMVYINEILYRAGILAATPNPENGGPVVDYSKTKAMGIPFGGHITINLKGRQDGGIVDPADYEAVQEEIVDALLDYRCPVSGKCPFSFVIRKQDAGMLAINEHSEHAGDIIFGVRTGYHIAAWLGPFLFYDYGSEAHKEKVNTPWGGMHGDNWPGVRYKGYSDMATFCGVGPGLKQGYEHQKVFRLTGVTPTICRLLNIDVADTCEGGALKEALK
ncbi:MAG: alkaline phosphatase family protein [Planctomycetota bacterium]|jgi:predicted AlkP superfamily phosphohydrolase/phosphomutase